MIGLENGRMLSECYVYSNICNAFLASILFLGDYLGGAIKGKS